MGSTGRTRSGRSHRTLDGQGHREPKDWTYESLRQMQDAENTIRIGNTDRLHSHNTIHFGTKVDTTNDTRVERALKSKLSQTTKLKGLLEETLAVAKKICAKGPLAVQACKGLLLTGPEQPLPNANRAEALAFGRCFDTTDQSVGMKAFLAKQDPAFTGE